MRKPTHQLVGLIVGLVSLPLIKEKIPMSTLEQGVCVAGSLVGSLLPDVDHTQSSAGRKLPLISRPMRWIANKAKERKHHKLAAALGHRGICHAPLLWIAFLIAALFFEYNIFVKALLVGICVGGLSHLMADILNPTGIPIFAPLSFKKVNLLSIKTGSMGEAAFAAILIVVSIIYFAETKDVIEIASLSEMKNSIGNFFG